MSVQAYHALAEMGLIPEKTELLHGQVFQKTSRSPLHSGLVRRLLRLIQKACPPGCFVSQEQPITCSESEPEPDVAVILGEEEDFWTKHPTTAELVVEIRVTSLEYDRSKLSAYAGAGVKECWFVLGQEKQIEVHRLPAGPSYSERSVHGPGGSLASNILPGFVLDLGSLFST